MFQNVPIFQNFQISKFFNFKISKSILKSAVLPASLMPLLTGQWLEAVRIVCTGLTQHWEKPFGKRSFDVRSYIVVEPSIQHSSILRSVTSNVLLRNTFEKHSSTLSMVTILNCWLRVLIWFQLGWLMTQLAHTCQMKNVTNYNWLAAVMIWIWQIFFEIFSSNSFHNSLFSEAD